jgi:LacI family transcriptional regulator
MSAPRRVTQSEIARLAGVSQAVVALVLGNKPGRVRAGEETRQKILQLAKDLNYRPHRGAQLMRGVPSGLIGHLKSPTYHEHHIAEGIYFGEAMAARDYEVLALDIQRRHKGLERGLEFFRDIRVEGLLLSRETLEIAASPAFGALLAAGVPVVSLEAPGEEISSRVHSVVVDHVQGMTLLMDHLLDRGFHRIAMVVEASVPHVTTRERIAAYQARMREAGLEADLVEVPRPDVESSVGLGMSLGWRGMETLLCRRRLPEAVCFQNDYFAEGALALCRERGVSVPEDLAVAGFDNSSMGEYRRPALTSVEQPMREVAEAAADLLARLIRGEADPGQAHTLRLPCRLRVRETTLRLAESGENNFHQTTAQA